jgi:hypothetical protein
LAGNILVLRYELKNLKESYGTPRTTFSALKVELEISLLTGAVSRYFQPDTKAQNRRRLN